MTLDDQQAFNPDELYDEFPSGEGRGFGQAEGFNRWVQVNDKRWFTEEALNDPVIRRFVQAPFTVTFGQFKSSTREAEYVIHKPHLAMTGRVEGIEGRIPNMPDSPRIQTLVVNHENTLAWRVTSSLVLEDGNVAANVVHKEGDGSY